MKSKNGEVNLCVEQMDPRIRLNQLNELDRTFRKSQTEHVKKQKSDIVLNWSRMDAAKRFEQLLFFSVYLRYGLKEVFLYQRMKEVLKRSCPRNFSASTLLYALSNREYSRFFLWDPRLVAAYTNAVLKDVWSDEEQEVGVCCTLDASYIEYYQRMPIQFSVEELVWALCDYVVWDLDTDSEMLMNEYSKIQNKAEKQLKEKLQKYGAVAYEGNETPASLLTSVAKEVARIKRGIELGYYVGWESVDQMIKRVVLEIIRNESVFQKGDQTRLVSASRLIYFMHQYDAECMLELPQDVAMKEWNTPTVYPAKADYQFQRARLTKTASAFGGYEDDKYQIVYDADEVSCKMMYGSLFSLAMMCRRYDIAKNELDRLGDDNIQFDITYWQYIKQSKQSIMSGDVTGLTYLICNDDGIPKKLLARLLKVERTRYLKYKRREHCEMYNFLGEELWMARPEDADFWEKPKIYRMNEKKYIRSYNALRKIATIDSKCFDFGEILQFNKSLGIEGKSWLAKKMIQLLPLFCTSLKSLRSYLIGSVEIFAIYNKQDEANRAVMKLYVEGLKEFVEQSNQLYQNDRLTKQTLLFHLLCVATLVHRNGWEEERCILHKCIWGLMCNEFEHRDEYSYSVAFSYSMLAFSTTKMLRLLDEEFAVAMNRVV